jgi:ATP-dependent DNA helicase RecG
MMIRQKPGQRLAFLAEADAESLAECLVAFANGDGGLVVLGLDEEGRPFDTIWEEDAEGALIEAADYCRPPVPTQWHSVNIGSGTFIGIQVPRSPDLHTLADGRVLVRSGNWNRPLAGDEVRQLASSKHSAEFETEVVPGARSTDLDQQIIREYFEQREARGASRIASIPEALFEIGATDRSGNPTMTGILLFGKNPQTFFPHSGVVFVKFPGTEPRGDDGGIGYGRRDEISGHLARVVERTWNIVYEEMRVGAKVNRLEREEVTEYPRYAVREAVVNAIAHRDYRIMGRRIEVRIYWTDFLRDYIEARDLVKPVGLGRIWRLVHEGTAPGPKPSLSAASPGELVKALSHANGWWRDTAQRLLVERAEKSVAPQLVTLAAKAPDWRTRLHVPPSTNSALVRVWRRSSLPRAMLLVQRMTRRTTGRWSQRI